MRGGGNDSYAQLSPVSETAVARFSELLRDFSSAAFAHNLLGRVSLRFLGDCGVATCAPERRVLG